MALQALNETQVFYRLNAQQSLAQKRFGQCNDLIRFLVHGEVACVQHMDLGPGHVLSVCLYPSHRKGWIVPAPEHEQRRLVLT